MRKIFILLSLFICFLAHPQEVCVLSSSVGDDVAMSYPVTTSCRVVLPLDVNKGSIVAMKWVVTLDEDPFMEVSWDTSSRVNKFLIQNFYLKDVGIYNIAFYYDIGTGFVVCDNDINIEITQSSSSGVVDFIHTSKSNSSDIAYVGSVGDSVYFFDKSSLVYGVSSFNWDFGDGNFSKEQNPVHVYSKKGSFTVTLNITGNDGVSYSKKKEKYVTIYDTLNPKISHEELLGVYIPSENIILVNINNEYGGTLDGLTWKTAYRSIEDAVSSAESIVQDNGFVQIWVCGGFYGNFSDMARFGDDQFKDPYVTIDSSNGSDSPYLISIFGGFSPSSSSFEDRDVSNNRTVFDFSGEGGFQVSGHVSFDGIEFIGGRYAIKSIGGIVDVNNCIFSFNNSVVPDNGVIMSENSSVTVSNSIISNNVCSSSLVLLTEDSGIFPSTINNCGFSSNVSHSGEYVSCNLNTPFMYSSLSNSEHSEYSGYIVVNKGINITDLGVGFYESTGVLSSLHNFYQDGNFFVFKISSIDVKLVKEILSKFGNVDFIYNYSNILEYTGEQISCNGNFSGEGSVNQNQATNGVIYSDKSILNILNSFFYKNYIEGQKSLVYINNGNLENCMFNSNTSELQYSIVDIFGNTPVVDVKDCSFLFNNASCVSVGDSSEDMDVNITLNNNLFSSNRNPIGLVLNTRGLVNSIEGDILFDNCVSVDNVATSILAENTPSCLFNLDDEVDYIFKDCKIYTCYDFEVEQGSSGIEFCGVNDNFVLQNTKVDYDCSSFNDAPPFSFKLKDELGNYIDIIGRGYKVFEDVVVGVFDFFNELRLSNASWVDGDVVIYEDNLYTVSAGNEGFKFSDCFGSELPSNIYSHVGYTLDYDDSYDGRYKKYGIYRDGSSVVLSDSGKGYFDLCVLYGYYSIEDGLLKVRKVCSDLNKIAKSAYLMQKEKSSDRYFNPYLLNFLSAVKVANGFEYYNVVTLAGEIKPLVGSAFIESGGLVLVPVEEGFMTPDIYPSSGGFFQDTELYDTFRVEGSVLESKVKLIVFGDPDNLSFLDYVKSYSFPVSCNNLSLSTNTLYCSNTVSSSNIVVTSDSPWACMSSVGWLYTDKTSGEAGGNLVVSVTENIGECREGQLFFINSGVSGDGIVLTVIQGEGCSSGNIDVYRDGVNLATVEGSVSLTKAYSVQEQSFNRYKLRDGINVLSITYGFLGSGGYVLAFKDSDSVFMCDNSLLSVSRNCLDVLELGSSFYQENGILNSVYLKSDISDMLENNFFYFIPKN